MIKKKNIVIISINLVMLSALLFCPQTKVNAQDIGWPRQKVTPAGKVVYYQPQVDSWTDQKQVIFRTAMTVTPNGKASATGVAVIQANTDVDMDKRIVSLHDLVVAETNFPSLDAAAAAKMDQTVKTFLPKDASISISLDRLVASVEKSADAPAVEVKNDPPNIFVSERSAILVQLDGPPVFGKIKDTSLEFVVNSNFPMFVDRSNNTYYLFSGQQWLMTADPTGKWSRAATLPKDMNNVKKDPQWSALASVIPAKQSATSVPDVFYSTSPAEALLFKGKPMYGQVPGTGLVFATNTESDLFVHNPTQTYYYLAAGRWFRSKNLQGPWSYASADLPDDFAKIPDNSRAARVLAYVPGTDAAKDAVLIAQIPTTTIVDPKTAAANAKVTYYGTPDFRPIEGTSLFYAINTAERVIRVDSSYYLCLNGVWFFSLAPQGPWETAKSVPAAIYSIPPGSPMYNVTYVTQMTTSAGVIQSSYTAGYLGTFIFRTPFGYVMGIGSGYYYPPYFYYPIYGYPIYWPYAATYGAWAYAGRYAIARGVYGPYRGITGAAAYNPYTGTYARRVTAYGPYGSASVGRAYNPYTGAVARGASVRTPYGSVAAIGSSTGAKAIVARGNYNSGGVVKTAGGDVYAGKNGNVYKKTNGGWSPVNAPRAKVPSSTVNGLNSEAQRRQRGAAQMRTWGGARARGWGGRRR